MDNNQQSSVTLIKTEEIYGDENIRILEKTWQNEKGQSFPSLSLAIEPDVAGTITKIEFKILAKGNDKAIIKSYLTKNKKG